MSLSSINQPMRILVTGGAGFIGSRLVHRLASRPEMRVSVLDDLSCRGSKVKPDLPDSIQFHRADICDAAALREAKDGADLVYHLAAISSVGAAQDDFGNAYRVNVIGTETVLKVAQAFGVRRVVFSSSREVYGEPSDLPVLESAPLLPKSAYGLTKASGESCCRVADRVDALVLRLANVYGSGDFGRVIPIFVRSALLGKPILLFGGEQILDFIWIDDVVDALIAAGANRTVAGPLNIGSGVGTQITDLARKIVALAGSSSPVHLLPKRDFEVMRFVADSSAAKRSLALEATADPLAHLGELVEWTRQQLSASDVGV